MSDFPPDEASEEWMGLTRASRAAGPVRPTSCRRPRARLWQPREHSRTSKAVSMGCPSGSRLRLARSRGGRRRPLPRGFGRL
jgi:hypothetical protein